MLPSWFSCAPCLILPSLLYHNVRQCQGKKYPPTVTSWSGADAPRRSAAPYCPRRSVRLCDTASQEVGPRGFSQVSVCSLPACPCPQSSTLLLIVKHYYGRRAGRDYGIG